MALSPLRAATWVVTSNLDDAAAPTAGMLRYAVNNSSSGDTLLFALGSGSETITIGGELAVSGKSLSIDGSNTGGSGTAVTITVPTPGASTYRVFTLAPGTGHTAALSHLTLMGGSVTLGGVVNCESGYSSLTGVALGSGQATNGGGLFLAPGAALQVADSVVQGNSATYGGGLYFGDHADVMLENTTVRGNSATMGGGLLVAANTTAELTGTTVSGNTASGNTTGSHGGGLMVLGSVALTNSTICGNSASGGGGGLMVQYANAAATLTHTTVSGNSAAGGGGLYAYNSAATLLNSIAVGNSASAGSDLCINLGSTGTLGAYASRYAGAYGTITTATTAPNVTTAYSAGELGALADNGGATPTMALNASAPAVGAGVSVYHNATVGHYFQGTDGSYYAAADVGTALSAGSIDPTGELLAADQRGVARRTPADIGAFQHCGLTAVGLPANGTYTTGDTLVFTCSFDDAVTVDTTGGIPRLSLDIGGSTRYADYVGGTGTRVLTFSYAIQAGDTDADGIGGGLLSLNGGTIADRVAAADLTLPTVAATGILIDTIAPDAPVVAAAGATTVTGQAEPGSTVTVYVDGSATPAGTATADATTGLWTCTLASPLTAGTTYSFTATATDAAGNCSDSSATFALAVGSSGGTWIVTSNADSATAPVASSLRYAMLNASAGDTIRFALPSGSETITLAAALPPIMGDLTIDGGTLGDVIIDGANAYRVFFVDSGTVALSNLWLQNALAQGGGGGSGDGGGGGGAGLGAGLFVNQATAVVTVTNVNFISMSATGGDGGAFVNQAYAGGGGGGMGFRGGSSTANTGAPGGGGMLASGSDASSGYNGGDGGAGGGGGGGRLNSGTAGLGGSAYAGNDAGSAASTTNGGAGGFGGGGGGAPLGTGGAGGFGGGGGGTGSSSSGGVGGPGGGGGGSDGVQSTFSGGSLGSGIAGGASGLGTGSGGGGGAAAGPAIFVRLGTLTTVNSGWYQSSATGGAGGMGRAGHSGTAGGANSTPTFNYGGTINGSAVTGPIPEALIDCVPTLTPVSLVSSNATPALAKPGDTVTLNFTATRSIASPTVTLGGHSVAATNTSGNNWTTSFTVDASETEGTVAFSIAFTATDGFAGTVVTATTDSSAVTIDTTAPTVPTNLAGSATSTTAITLTWTASTDMIGVAGYRIYRGGTVIGTSTTTSYADTGLTAGTAYTYTVTAYDTVANESAASTAVTVSTQLDGAQTLAVTTTTELTEALATAAANPSATFTITVAAGTYTPTTGLTISTDGLTLEGSGTISGSALTSGELLTISGGSIVLSGLTIADGTVAILTDADHGTITDCTFASASITGTGCPGWTITGNSLSDATTALTFTDADDLTLTDNVIVDCAQALVLADLSAPTVRNNFIANNSTSATTASILLNEVTEAQIDNNTVYQAGTAANAIEYAGSSAVGAIRNNLANKLITATGTATATLATNYTAALASWFSDVPDGDLHLAATQSAVVNAGTTISDLTADIDGDTRPTGSAYDIGADEFQPDTVAPSAPAGLSAVLIAQTRIVLNWTASTDSAPSGVTPAGVIGYRIYRNGTAVGTSMTTSYSDTGLAAGTAYGYTVTAYDGAANESTASTALRVTTTAAAGADDGRKHGGGGAISLWFTAALALLASARTLRLRRNV